LNELTEPQRQFLTKYGFDPAVFARWQEDLVAGRLSKAGNAVTEELLAPPEGTIQKLPAGNSKAWRELEKLGRAAIAQGQLGVVVLNGGMATRFGGVVKGVVPVLGADRSFLALCCEDIQAAQRSCGGTVPLFLMNSFNTDAATKAHFQEHGDFGLPAAQLHHFTQFVALRLEKNGTLFRLANGEPSFYGPGHGDFAPAFRRHCLQEFLAQGGRYLLVRNVDNLGARIEPAILGHHIKTQAEVTVELAPKWPEDVGGSPYLYRGRTQLVEQVRYPAGFDPNIVDVFNTNTFTFSATALDRDFDMGWYYVEKEVEGRKAVQVEHLIGELTAHLRTNFLQVRRSGTKTRFLPIKVPADLDAARAEIAEMYDSSGGGGE
jgi:UTP--glucose-1-phosphate uridylyltransferase